MEQVVKIDNLTELYERTKGSQVTAQQIINGRANIDGNWQSFELHEDVRRSVFSEIANVLGGRRKTKELIEYRLCMKPQHWGLSRIVLERYNGGAPFFSYIAGQDMPSELAMIRKQLK